MIVSYDPNSSALSRESEGHYETEKAFSSYAGIIQVTLPIAYTIQSPYIEI